MLNLLLRTHVSIPQAVSAIAIQFLVSFALAVNFSKVSIPQAVSAIAIVKTGEVTVQWKPRFNTASGKCYCNKLIRIADKLTLGKIKVSIPQAVSAIAMISKLFAFGGDIMKVSIPQAVSAIAINRKRKRLVRCHAVSIPQAVSAIAMISIDLSNVDISCKFQYRKR